MRKVELADATESLAHYVQSMEEGPLVVTRYGRPIALLVSVADADVETVALSHHPGFLEAIERSRDRQKRGGGLSSAEVRALFASHS